MGDAAGILGAQTALAGYGTQISALRINVTVKEGKANFRLSVVVSPQGAARLVSQNASDPTTTTTTNQASVPKTPANAENQAGAKKLNYPFTLLEIRENAEISAVPALSTKA
jgi:general secretion pathway protein K